VPWFTSLRLWLETYRPGYTAKVLEVDVKTNGDSPFSEVLFASLKLSSRCLPFISTSNNPVFNRRFEMRISNQFRNAGLAVVGHQKKQFGAAKATNNYSA
jgi:hypothetical protein